MAGSRGAGGTRAPGAARLAARPGEAHARSRLRCTRWPLRQRACARQVRGVTRCHATAAHAAACAPQRCTRQRLRRVPPNWAQGVPFRGAPGRVARAFDAHTPPGVRGGARRAAATPCRNACAAAACAGQHRVGPSCPQTRAHAPATLEAAGGARGSLRPGPRGCRTHAETGAKAYELPRRRRAARRSRRRARPRAPARHKRLFKSNRHHLGLHDAFSQWSQSLGAGGSRRRTCAARACEKHAARKRRARSCARKILFTHPRVRTLVPALADESSPAICQDQATVRS
jgi:hypothetical protein